jgi:anti-sigma factor RsiW
MRRSVTRKEEWKMHESEGRLRAYLDGALPSEEAHGVEKHLRSCERCQNRLEALHGERETSAAALAALQEPAGVTEVSAYRALHNLESRIQGESRTERSVVEMFKLMTSRHWRAAWAGVAALVILSLFVFYPPLRTAAADFLGVFRVQKFTAVPVDISALQGNTTFANILEAAFSDQVEILREAGPSSVVNSTEEASALVGFGARVPSQMPDGYGDTPTMRVEDSPAFRVTVKTEYIKQLQEALGNTDVPIPEGLDGATVNVDIPKIFTAMYMSDHSVLTLIEARSPEIDLPPTLNLTQLGEFALRMAGMPETEAAAMAASIDWATTLIVPIPMNEATYSEVTVAGSQGLVIGSEGGEQRLLVFEKDNIVYGFEGPATPESLVAAAESMF